MGSWIGKLHDNTKWLPEHYLLDAAHKSSTQTVSETSKLLGDGADSLGINSHLPRYWEGKANRDHDSFGTWGENTIGGIGTVLGGMYALGAGGTGGTVGGVAEGAGPAAGNGAFLGEGASSGVPLWDAAEFNSIGQTGGLPSGGNMDIPGGMSGKIPSNITGLGGMGGMNMGSMFGGGQQGGAQRSGRQNLPFMENEKTDQQKLAELLGALQQQNGAA